MFIQTEENFMFRNTICALALGLTILPASAEEKTEWLKIAEFTNQQFARCGGHMKGSVPYRDDQVQKMLADGWKLELSSPYTLINTGLRATKEIYVNSGIPNSYIKRDYYPDGSPVLGEWAIQMLTCANNNGTI